MDEHFSGALPDGADELLPARLSVTAPEAIYLEHAALMRHVAVRKFGIPTDDAEALVHDVFIKLLVTPRQINRDLRQYLIAAICNACRNYWRSRKSEERVLAAATDEENCGYQDLLAGLSTNMLVARTLARLGPRCREILKRYYLDGEASAVVADAMNTTKSNVNYLMHVCRKRARAIYEELTRSS